MVDGSSLYVCVRLRISLFYLTVRCRSVVQFWVHAVGSIEFALVVGGCDEDLL